MTAKTRTAEDDLQRDLQREAMVRAILSAPIEMNHQTIAEQVGIGRENVRLIRIGLRHANLAPELPRIDPRHVTRKCTQCRHFIHKKSRTIDPKAGIDHKSMGSCGLGIPEAYYLAYARGCGAFAEAAA